MGNKGKFSVWTGLVSVVLLLATPVAWAAAPATAGECVSALRDLGTVLPGSVWCSQPAQVHGQSDCGVATGGRDAFANAWIDAGTQLLSMEAAVAVATSANAWIDAGTQQLSMQSMETVATSANAWIDAGTRTLMPVSAGGPFSSAQAIVCSATGQG